MLESVAWVVALLLDRQTSATYSAPAVHRPEVELGVNLMVSDILMMTQLYVASGGLPLPRVGADRKSTSVGEVLEKTGCGVDVGRQD